MNIKNRVEKIENQMNENKEESAEAKELSRRITKARERMTRLGYKFEPHVPLKTIMTGGKLDIAAMLQEARERHLKNNAKPCGRGGRQSETKSSE